MTHNIVTSGDYRYCSLCGEVSTAGFSVVCKSALEQEKMKAEAAMEQEKMKAEAATAQEKMKAEAAAAQEKMRLATWIFIALITLAVTVFFFHGAVSWGDKTADKVVTSLNAGFGKGRNGLGAVAVAVGAGILAQLGPDNYVSAGIRHIFSALRCLVRA
jgi:hypothetical protein